MDATVPFLKGFEEEADRDPERNEPNALSNSANDTSEIQDGDGNDQNRRPLFSCSPRSVPCVINRVLIVVIGVAVGFILILPNAMISDSGTNAAVLGANLGLAACFFFVVGGIFGACIGRWIGWVIMLVPGIVLQISAFGAAGYL